MKLLMVTPYFYPKIGGLENYAWNIAKRLKADHKVEVVVVTSNHAQKKYKQEIIEGIKIYRLPILFKLSNTPINPMWIMSLKKIIKEERPNIINGHSPVPFMADIAQMVSGKIPYVLTYHAESMLKNNFFKDLIIKLYESFVLSKLLNSSSKIVPISSRFIPNKFKDKIVSIPPGVDTDMFAPIVKKDAKKVLFVGSLEKSSTWKGLYYLFDAVVIVKRKIKDVHLQVIGDGDAVDIYKKYVKTHGLNGNVDFLGTLTGKTLAKKYQESNLLVLPSITNAESFGIVLIEAMSTNTPVIGSRVGGIPNVIDNNVNGLLVEPKNPELLAGAILKILNDVEFSKKLGQNGRNKVINNYSWDTSAKRFNLVLNELN